MRFRTKSFATFTLIDNLGPPSAYVSEVNTGRLDQLAVQTWLMLIVIKHNFGEEKTGGAVEEWEKIKSKAGVNPNSLFQRDVWWPGRAWGGWFGKLHEELKEENTHKQNQKQT